MTKHRGYKIWRVDGFQEEYRQVFELCRRVKAFNYMAKITCTSYSCVCTTFLCLLVFLIPRFLRKKKGVRGKVRGCRTMSRLVLAWSDNSSDRGSLALLLKRRRFGTAVRTCTAFIGEKDRILKTFPPVRYDIDSCKCNTDQV